MKVQRNRKIIAYYRQGFSLREIAKFYGVSMQRIHQIMVRDFPDIIRDAHDTRNNSTGRSSSRRS